MRLYLRLLGAAIRGKMQYKWDFVFSTLLYAVLTAIDFLTVAIILLRYEVIAGWSLYEVALLAGVAAASYGLYRVFAAELDAFERYLVGGDYDSLLIRPWPALLSLLVRTFDLGRVGAILQGYLVLSLGLAGVRGQGAPAWLALYAYLLPLAGALTIAAIAIAVAGIGFYLTRISELQIFAINASMAAANYPSLIFPRWMRGLLTGLLPVTAFTYIPLNYALGKGGTPLSLLTPFWVAPLACLVALQIYRVGERRYQSTGT